ncbi:MAG: hypothetical protein K1X28_08635 [Parachlamydiales bacterium]|nr:hypothetical protein [Parachlamydiales bacterium]
MTHITPKHYYDEGLTNLLKAPEYAVTQFTKAMESQNLRMGALYLRATAYHRMNDLQRAAADFHAMIREFDAQKLAFETKHLDIVKKTASIYLQLKNYPEAMSLTLRGLYETLGQKESVDFLVLSAKIYIDLKEPDSARKELEKAAAFKVFHRELKNLLDSLPARMPKLEKEEPRIVFKDDTPPSDGPCKVQ